MNRDQDVDEVAKNPQQNNLGAKQHIQFGRANFVPIWPQCRTA